MTHKVAVIVGSLRKSSFSRALAKAMVALAPATLDFEFVPLENLPLYVQDLDDEGRAPPPWLNFRERVDASDAVLFVTPEYNRSIPGCLKNALDVGSRPYGRSVWNAKPAAVVSNSPGAMGGFGANHHLRQCLVFLNMPALQQPEAYVGGVGSLLGEGGEVINDESQEFLAGFMSAFAAWIGKEA